MPVLHRRGSKKSDSISPLRASVGFPPELYHSLEEIAKQKKVSVAWVVRDAAEQYVAGAAPLSRNLKGA